MPRNDQVTGIEVEESEQATAEPLEAEEPPSPKPRPLDKGKQKATDDQNVQSLRCRADSEADGFVKVPANIPELSFPEMARTNQTATHRGLPFKWNWSVKPFIPRNFIAPPPGFTAFLGDRAAGLYLPTNSYPSSSKWSHELLLQEFPVAHAGASRSTRVTTTPEPKRPSSPEIGNMKSQGQSQRNKDNPNINTDEQPEHASDGIGSGNADDTNSDSISDTRSVDSCSSKATCGSIRSDDSAISVATVSPAIRSTRTPAGNHDNPTLFVFNPNAPDFVPICTANTISNGNGHLSGKIDKWKATRPTIMRPDLPEKNPPCVTGHYYYDGMPNERVS